MATIGTPHTVRAYDSDLHKLHSTIVQMGTLAHEQLAGSIEALSQRDGALASHIMANDAKVDDGDHMVNELTVRLLALRSPVADDLRQVVSTLKAASELERVADLAVNIAKRVLVLNQLPPPPAPPLGGIVRMAEMVIELLKTVVVSYDQRNIDAAVDVWRRDQEVDDQCSALFRELLTYMMEDPRNITTCSHLMFIGKNIERAGDHATNVAEVTYYMITGETLGGDRPKSDTSSFCLE